MGRTIILIDGENFRFKVEKVLQQSRLNSYKYEAISLGVLLEKKFSGYNNLHIMETRYYCAKLQVYKETKEKSHTKIDLQRRLKMNLEKQNIKFVIEGNVRRRELNVNGVKRYVFNEKGVDVQIAVDMVTLACDRKIDTVILCSSDSDLQPALKEVKKRGVKTVYLGFSIEPNKGLEVTCDQTVLFTNEEIASVFNKHIPC